MTYDERTFHGLIPLVPKGWPEDEPLLLLKDVKWLMQKRQAEAAARDPEAVRLLLDAREQLDRLTAIIEGRDEVARLVAPHGQTSNRPRAVTERIDRYLAASPEPAKGLNAIVEAIPDLFLLRIDYSQGMREKFDQAPWHVTVERWPQSGDKTVEGGYADTFDEAVARLQQQSEPAALREDGDAEVPE